MSDLDFINARRKPLAEERAMWSLVSEPSRLPHHEKAAALDEFRAEPQSLTG